MPIVSASAERIWASLAAFIVSRIWASDLPGVWAATLRAWASCSSLTTPRSSSRASTLLRALAACSGAQSCSNSLTTSSALPAGLFAGALGFSPPLGAGASEGVFFRPNIRFCPSPVGPSSVARPRLRGALLLHLQLELQEGVGGGGCDG